MMDAASAVCCSRWLANRREKHCRSYAMSANTINFRNMFNNDSDGFFFEQIERLNEVRLPERTQ